ncbi:tannase/feruloyl esterase family alpha/beta hydrolase [Xanthomonas oryzae pv. oryzae]|nr:tannase/feruloyl esterase family alpha/beta hydrolase [Xanthomonas oryzae]AVU04698.1 tannase/feruloyl esterase family alpha/beta hydrolase [Xanthomonas oryzae pv. oryzae]QBI17906.1 tannase/feruloyl esterase family alpha/beta hydrolase [Xanthomonas oryzae pv. oryzae]QBN41228.1 tannase/feruloyl esterase family alpha/beta hydrolase [Xanthomonas oryzae pv. oryzae]QBN44867.1 tannase/feruloyl esterase family alpha/beta hydrolase [Xanthomonas oryzae pv. oryzae]QBN48520.1 tannase/feruloyl esterase 
MWLVAASAFASCSDLLNLSLSSATISTADDVPAGSFSAPDGTVVQGLPAFCRVVGVARPNSDSEIGFEVWIPASGWNAKYLQVGTLVFAGTIQYNSLGFALRRGYATATTDGGHRGSAGDASFAINHPQKIIDWGYRALAKTALYGKQIVSAYTHTAPRYSYFFGSSSGGRDALMAVQRYPNAFDGVIADAPSADWTHNAFSWLWSEDAEFGNPAATIAAAKLPAIQAAALAQCDAKDSTVDGVVNDPRLCRFDPSVLLCSAAETDSCLTAEQIMALDSILSGPVNPRTGQRIYPGFEPFAVATPTFWDRWVTGNATVPGGGHALLANHFFANMVFNTDSASFDHTKVNFDGDAALTNRTSIAGQWLSHVINATSPDLSLFRARNGKLLLYIGWEDPVVPPRGMIAYYESVVAKLHSDSASAASDDDAVRHTQQFFRLFMVPGMGHFTGGPGATAFGALYGAPGLAIDRQHDVLSAMEAWVEQGVAPDRIVAAKYVNDDPAQGVLRTRPLCSYPQSAQWTGHGDSNQEQNFVCRDSPRGAYPGSADAGLPR